MNEEYTAFKLAELRWSSLRLSATVAEYSVLSNSPFVLPTKFKTDHAPAPLIDVAWSSCRSAVPPSELASRFPAPDKTPPAGPSTGPCTGIAPRSPTPGIPDKPVVGDCGRKLKESERLKTHFRVT